MKQSVVPLARVLCLALAVSVSGLSFDWRPVDPANLALTTPKVEADADAEVIFWDVRIRDEVTGQDAQTVLSHYMRVKVYNDRGVEDQSSVDLAWVGKGQVRDIEGRTIKPDGTIVELDESSIFERTIVKARGVKVKAKSFTMPAVEPGAIIEYSWKRYQDDVISNYLRLEFQKEIPIWHVRYHVKPYPDPYQVIGTMKAKSFQCQNSPFVAEPQGYYMSELSSIPAFREEPRMPPEDIVRSWVLIYYSKENFRNEADVNKHWQRIGKEQHRAETDRMKVSGAVKKAAVSIIGDAATPEEKLDRLLRFCRYEIKNVYHDAHGLSVTDREQFDKKRKRKHRPEDTLKIGMGYGTDVNRLFGALARAAGFDVRMALLPGRNQTYFDRSFPDLYYLNRRSIAVELDGQWRFYDPSSLYATGGMLTWPEEGTYALVVDPKQTSFVTTPLAPPEKSGIHRQADLRLTEDGTIEGTVRVEYTGHPGSSRKRRYDGMTEAEREEAIIEAVEGRLSTAELSDIQFHNVNDPDKPFGYEYSIRVPGYAQVTGKRVFVQPAYFQMGTAATFVTSERKHDIYFDYPWSEQDTLTIELPGGFEGDNVEAPSSFSLGGVGEYRAKLGFSEAGKLVYERTFDFGREGKIMFPKVAYPQLKTIFDRIHSEDNRLVTLKLAAVAAN